MNEKDIRDRIGKFLKRTAHTVLVPATMGLGLSSTGCESHGLHKAGDAGLDARATQADGPVDLAQDAASHDLPLMMVPYVVAMAWDAAADPAPVLDATGEVSPDIRADTPSPTPPYGLPPLKGDGGQGGHLDSK